MVTVKDIYDYINTFAPYSSQCEWDNCGILIGDKDKKVKRIGFVLDLTDESLCDAVSKSVDLVITHHPVIFKAQKSFLKGNIAFEAAMKGITVLSAHTCFDCAEGGVNDVLCNILGIRNAVGVPSDSCSVPMARIGTVDEISSEQFAEFVSKKLKTVCRVADCGNIIRKVAVCGGAGADFIDDAVKMGADAYVTGDMDHHDFLHAVDAGITVVAAGHYETENPSLAALKEKICADFSEIEGILLKQCNPVKYVG
ncbi:MAG: Nif3-like dinuclear metal center hexameric protein [Clostridia bacterium]|nr:Nif3-like dinuclear metal center hexameric protein [Clostridia bacterium]